MSSLDPRLPFPGGDPRAFGANHTHRPQGKGNQLLRRRIGQNLGFGGFMASSRDRTSSASL